MCVEVITNNFAVIHEAEQLHFAVSIRLDRKFFLVRFLDEYDADASRKDDIRRLESLLKLFTKRLSFIAEQHSRYGNKQNVDLPFLNSSRSSFRSRTPRFLALAKKPQPIKISEYCRLLRQCVFSLVADQLADLLHVTRRVLKWVRVKRPQVIQVQKPLYPTNKSRLMRGNSTSRIAFHRSHRIQL